jgi:hypothetical protein
MYTDPWNAALSVSGSAVLPVSLTLMLMIFSTWLVS